MACTSCQQRREQIVNGFYAIGSIIFGPKGPVVVKADQQIRDGNADLVRIAVEEGKRGQPGS